MRPHPRIRKTVKWGGATLCAVLVAVWMGTCGTLYTWSSGGGHFMGVGGGGFGAWMYPSEDASGPSGWVRVKRENDQVRWFVLAFREWNFWLIVVPFWFPVGFGGIGAATAWRLDALARRRANLGTCPKCGYSRAGLAPSAVCPECGAPAGNETPAAR